MATSSRTQVLLIVYRLAHLLARVRCHCHSFIYFNFHLCFLLIYSYSSCFNSFDMISSCPLIFNRFAIYLFINLFQFICSIYCWYFNLLFHFLSILKTLCKDTQSLAMEIEVDNVLVALEMNKITNKSYRAIRKLTNDVK
jgi:hypothetical protein